MVAARDAALPAYVKVTYKKAICPHVTVISYNRKLLFRSHMLAWFDTRALSVSVHYLMLWMFSAH